MLATSSSSARLRGISESNDAVAAALDAAVAAATKAAAVDAVAQGFLSLPLPSDQQNKASGSSALPSFSAALGASSSSEATVPVAVSPHLAPAIPVAPAPTAASSSFAQSTRGALPEAQPSHPSSQRPISEDPVAAVQVALVPLSKEQLLKTPQDRGIEFIKNLNLPITLKHSVDLICEWVTFLVHKKVKNESFDLNQHLDYTKENLEKFKAGERVFDLSSELVEARLQKDIPGACSNTYREFVEKHYSQGGNMSYAARLNDSYRGKNPPLSMATPSLKAFPITSHKGAKFSPFAYAARSLQVPPLKKAPSSSAALRTVFSSEMTVAAASSSRLAPGPFLAPGPQALRASPTQQNAGIEVEEELEIAKPLSPEEAGIEFIKKLRIHRDSEQCIRPLLTWVTFLVEKQKKDKNFDLEDILDKTRNAILKDWDEQSELTLNYAPFNKRLRDIRQTPQYSLLCAEFGGYKCSNLTYYNSLLNAFKTSQLSPWVVVLAPSQWKKKPPVAISSVDAAPAAPVAPLQSSSNVTLAPNSTSGTNLTRAASSSRSAIGDNANLDQASQKKQRSLKSIQAEGITFIKGLKLSQNLKADSLETIYRWVAFLVHKKEQDTKFKLEKHLKATEKLLTSPIDFDPLLTQFAHYLPVKRTSAYYEFQQAQYYQGEDLRYVENLKKSYQEAQLSAPLPSSRVMIPKGSDSSSSSSSSAVPFFGAASSSSSSASAAAVPSPSPAAPPPASLKRPRTPINGPQPTDAAGPPQKRQKTDQVVDLTEE